MINTFGPCAVHELMDNSPFNEEVTNTVRALAYDLRKADEEMGDKHLHGESLK
jgi:hypothetical protein